MIEGQGEVMRVTKIDNEADLAILRSVSRELPVEAVMDPIFAVLADKMAKTMVAPENDGVGIAGPQVGLLRRVIVVQRLDYKEVWLRGLKHSSTKRAIRKGSKVQILPLPCILTIYSHLAQWWSVRLLTDRL